MYGLVNRAIEDLVISSAGNDVWKQITQKAGVENIQLLDSTNYDDELTYELVAAASEVLNQPAADILYAFGRHWVLYTGREGWVKLFNTGAEDFVSFLVQLDDMHTRVRSAMPEGRMPEFNLVEEDEQLTLEYHSDREGLAPMVLGILAGLAEQYGESWQVTHVGKREEEGFDRFLLTAIQNREISDNRDAA